MKELLKRKGMSRRDFHATLAKLGLGFGAVAAFGKPSAAAGELTVLEWAGYDVPELFPSYAEKYGGGPQFSLFGSEEEALQR
jgi:spermidine/putrescine transport system substrate-binding protein